MTGAADHVAFIVLAAALPVHALVAWRRLRRRLGEGVAGARLAAYAETIVIEWALAVLLLVLWIATGRTLGAIGLDVAVEPPFLLTTAVVVVLTALMLRQIAAVRGISGESESALRRQLAPVEALMPHTPGEHSVFKALAFTAGVCEELLYRGFLIHYLSPWLGPWGAAVASSVLFGITHAYQGARGIVKTGAVGLGLAAAYVLSGSLWPAILLHIAIDVQGGAIGFEMFGRRRAETLAGSAPV